MVDKDGIITTIAGIGGASGYSGDGGPAVEAMISSPRGLSFDSAGNLYIAETNNRCIRMVDKDGIITTIAGIGRSSGYSGDGGPATEAQFKSPQGLAFDSAGNLYIADSSNHCVRFVKLAGSDIPAAPALTPDTTENFLGRELTLTFTDDEAWREAITGITINGSPAESSKYAITPGELILQPDLFTATGDYTIVIRADGYNDAAVTQTIKSQVTVTLNLSKSTAEAGESITASGTALPNAWVPLKIVDSKEELIFFDATKADANGNYSFDLIIPPWIDGVLNIVAGSAADVAVKSITVTASSGDTTPPTWTNGKLTASKVSVTALTLTWSGASDNVAVTGYKVYRDSTLLTVTPLSGTSYNVTGLNADTSYTFTVQALDAAGNESKNGPGITIKTNAVLPITEDNIAIKEDGSNEHLAITEDTPEKVSITLPAGITEATISVSALLNAPESGTVTTKALPELNISKDSSISASPVQVAIPAGTTISAAESWDGSINMPSIRTNDTVTVAPDSGKSAAVNTVIEIGGEDLPLTLSKAVRILIPGQGGKDVGYSRGGVFSKITNLLTSDSQAAGDALPAGGDGRIDIGNDLVIWTKHFTKFITYTQTAISSGTSSGGGGTTTAPQAVTSTTGLAKVSPSAGGTIGLGSEATVRIPANALKGSSPLEVKVQKVTAPSEIPAALKPLGDLYEFSVEGQSNYSFAKNVTLTLAFDPSLLEQGKKADIYYYDPAQTRWESLGGTVSGAAISVQVDHFGVYTVMMAETAGEPAPDKPSVSLTDTSGHWAKEKINKLIGLGAISGYPDGTFKPDNNITRAEFATILVKAFALNPQSGPAFTDTAGHWAGNYIAIAAAHGIVNGYDTNTFGPDDPITREQAAVMIFKAAQLTTTTAEVTFADSGDISAWAKEALAAIVQEEIMSGYPDGTFGPRKNATRAEAVTVIVNALEL